jgi:hypothetical protein
MIMLYVAVTPPVVWVTLIIAGLAALVTLRPKGSIVHAAALILVIAQAAVAFTALWATADYPIGGLACLVGYTGSRVLVMVLLALIGTLATFLVAARQATVRFLAERKGFTAAFALLQLLTLGATYRSALLCTV